MAVSWGTIRSLLIFFGPILLPRAIGYYRKIRNTPRPQGVSIQPVPADVTRILTILGGASLVYLIWTLPIFAPDNVFRLTQSRLQIPTDVLFNRLASLRPDGTLTVTDGLLRPKLVSLESRLLYLQYGPDVMAGCPFCNSENPRTYFGYAIIDLIIPHLANLFLVGGVTSSLMSLNTAKSHPQPGQVLQQPADPTPQKRWRTPFTIAACSLALFDMYLLYSFDRTTNSRATKLPEIDFFHWRLRTYRFLSLFLLNALLALCLYLSSTNRFFVRQPPLAERLELINKSLAGTRARMNAAAIVKNTVARDEGLRQMGNGYWAHEGRLMREVMEDREVVEGVNDALGSGRIRVEVIERDAEGYVGNVLSAVGQGDGAG